jgi:hypothetical protein
MGLWTKGHDHRFRQEGRQCAPGTSTENIFAEDEKWELLKLPGYVACKQWRGNWLPAT